MDLTLLLCHLLLHLRRRHRCVWYGCGNIKWNTGIGCRTMDRTRTSTSPVIATMDFALLLCPLLRHLRRRRLRWF